MRRELGVDNQSNVERRTLAENMARIRMTSTALTKQNK